MKRYLFSSVIALFVLFSCTQTKEDKIRNEFKNYVSSNFDDPNSLKEIVSIEQIDTVTYESIRNGVIALHALDSLAESIKSIEEELSESNLSKIRAHQYHSYYKDDLRDLIMKRAKLSRDMLSWHDDYGLTMLHTMSDSVDNLLARLKGLNIYQYKIKTRIKHGEDLKLTEYYALEDSVGYRFFNKKPTFNDYSERTAIFYKVAREYEEIMNLRRDIINEQLELDKKIHSILN